MNIAEIMKRERADLPDKVALRSASYSVSYRDLFRQMERISARLSDIAETAEYERIALYMREGADYIVCNLAVLSLSGVVVPVPPSSTIQEVHELLHEMSISVLLTDSQITFKGKVCGQFSGPFENKSLKIYRFETENFLYEEEFKKLNPAFVRFTSGTTGDAKGVVLSHETIIERTDAADRVLKVTQSDNVLWVLSMSFHFVVTILLFLRRGAAIYLCRPQFPEGVVEGLREGDISFIYAAPFYYQTMMKAPGISKDYFAHVRTAISTTGALSAALSHEFKREFHIDLSSAYGIIEIGLPFVNSSHLADKQGTVGVVTPGYSYKISGADKNAIGQVLVKGPGMFDAYFKPWCLREDSLREGWFVTSDMGRVDDDGFLTLFGRSREVINFMGHKIFPLEIEMVLDSHPAILESRVFGIEHPSFGQIPVAEVVLAEEAGEVGVDALRQFCYSNMAKYKVPKDFHFVGGLKRTKSGKVIVRP